MYTSKYDTLNQHVIISSELYHKLKLFLASFEAVFAEADLGRTKDSRIPRHSLLENRGYDTDTDRHNRRILLTEYRALKDELEKTVLVCTATVQTASDDGII